MDHFLICTATALWQLPCQVAWHICELTRGDMAYDSSNKLLFCPSAFRIALSTQGRPFRLASWTKKLITSNTKISSFTGLGEQDRWGMGMGQGYEIPLCDSEMWKHITIYLPKSTEFTAWRMNSSANYRHQLVIGNQDQLVICTHMSIDTNTQQSSREEEGGWGGETGIFSSSVLPLFARTEATLKVRSGFVFTAWMEILVIQSRTCQWNPKYSLINNGLSSPHGDRVAVCLQHNQSKQTITQVQGTLNPHPLRESKQSVTGSNFCFVNTQLWTPSQLNMNMCLSQIYSKPLLK